MDTALRCYICDAACGTIGQLGQIEIGLGDEVDQIWIWQPGLHMIVDHDALFDAAALDGDGKVNGEWR